ncbi:MAG: DinB family protein [Armatimonadetes bacterium]|nr:DinB family protein [Armatimonadota bacterium]
MTTHELLKARFNFVRRDLDKTLDRFTDDQMNWCPSPGLKTVSGQILEIADKDREAVIWLKTGTWPDDDPPSFDLETTTLTESRAVLANIRETTFAYIDSMTEDELEIDVQSPEKWWEALRLTECPRSEVLRNIAAHEWYHTAQLVTYRGLLGDDLDAW